MLYNNGQIYRMNDEEKALLRKIFNFPLKMVYPPDMVKNNPLNPGVPDQPASITIPLKEVLRNQDGETEEWRWCNTIGRDNKGLIRYIPRNIHFNGSLRIEGTDLELLYFLYFKSPHCQNGAVPENFRKKLYFALEDPTKIASDKVVRESDYAKYKYSLYNEEGLPEHILRAVAKAYFIPDVDKLTFDQVRVAIDFEVNRDKKEGIKKFAEMSDMGEYSKARALIQGAIDNKLVIFHPSSRSWCWPDPDINSKRKGEEICKVLGKANQNEALVDYYRGNVQFSERLHHEMKNESAMAPVSDIVKADKLAKGKNG